MTSPRRGLIGMSMATALLCVAPFSAARAQSESDQVQTAIDGLLDAYGGRNRLARISAYRMDGTVHAYGRGTQGKTVRTFARPHQLKVVIDYPERSEVRILDGPKGWRTGGSGNFVEVTGVMHAAMVLQAARANIPWVLDDLREHAHVADSREYEGRQLSGIGFTVAEGLSLQIYFDPETYRIVRTRAQLDFGHMQTEFETIYSDFREVDGVLFPFREESFASGVHTGHTIIERVIVNPELAEGEFTPTPRGARVRT